MQADPQNSNVYVGNVAPEVSDQELRRHFQQFGNVLEVKTYRKGSYGFVHFEVGPALCSGLAHSPNNLRTPIESLANLNSSVRLLFESTREGKRASVG